MIGGSVAVSSALSSLEFAMLRSALLAALLLGPTAGLAAEVDCSTSANQMDANICAGQEFDRVDAELNRRYATLRGKLDENGRRNLVAAERAWIAFRDLECNLRTGFNTLTPDENGTIAPMLMGQCKTALTRRRIQDLAAQIKCPGGDLSCPP